MFSKIRPHKGVSTYGIRTRVAQRPETGLPTELPGFGSRGLKLVPYRWGRVVSLGESENFYRQIMAAHLTVDPVAMLVYIHEKYM